MAALSRSLELTYTDPSQNTKEFTISNINATLTKAELQACVSAITAVWRNTLNATYVTQKVDLNELD